MKKYFKKEINNNKKIMVYKISIKQYIKKIYNKNDNKLTIKQ